MRTLSEITPGLQTRLVNDTWEQSGHGALLFAGTLLTVLDETDAGDVVVAANGRKVVLPQSTAVTEPVRTY